MAGKTVMTRGASAVMENRAPADVEGDDPLRALHRRLDFFATPPWAARAGAELVRALDPDAKVIREPAYGKGHIAGPLADYFPIILASDVHAHRAGVEIRDWLDDSAWSDEPDCDWVITNPPFKIADEFVTRGLRRARRGVALLLRIAFLETPGRHALFTGESPLTQVSIFTERVSMTLGDWDPEAGLATCFAWFVWMKGATPRAPAWFGRRATLRQTAPARSVPGPLAACGQRGDGRRLTGDCRRTTPLGDGDGDGDGLTRGPHSPQSLQAGSSRGELMGAIPLPPTLLQGAGAHRREGDDHAHGIRGR